MFQVKIYVSIKKTVADPQGKTVKTALTSLGYGGVADVRVGKYMEIKLKSQSKAAAEKQVADMCKKLLVNPIIEDFTYTIEEV